MRVPAAVVVLLVGAIWALVHIQYRTLDGWLELAFRYGATPRRRVWRPSGANPATGPSPTEVDHQQGWYQLERVRVRWALAPTPNHQLELETDPAPERSGGVR